MSLLLFGLGEFFVLAFEQAIFQHIVETTKDGLLVVDSEQLIRFANPAATAYLSHSDEELVDSVCWLPFDVEQSVVYEMACPKGDTAVFEIKATEIQWEGEPAHLLTLDNITQDRRLMEHARQATLLGDITRAATESLSRQELFQILADRLGELHRADGCFLTLWDAEQKTAVLGATFGPLKDLYPHYFANNGLMRLIGAEHKPVVVENIRQSRYFANSGTHKMPICSLLLLPLTLNEQYLGAVVLLFMQPIQFSDSLLTQAQQAAEQTSLVLAKEKLYAETKLRSDDLETLTAVSADLRACRRVADMLPLILQTADLTEQTVATIFLFDPHHDSLVVSGSHPANTHLMQQSFPKSGILHHLLITRRPYLTQQLANDPLADEHLKEIAQFKPASNHIFLPLQAEETDILGILHVGLLSSRDFTNREVRLLTAVTEIAVSALQRTRLLETLEERVTVRTKELADANHKLRQLDRLRAKFVTDMSHELRTPITTFQLYLDLIQRAPPQKQDRYFSILQTQTARLTRLVEKALTLSRVDFAQETISFELVDFQNVIETAVHTYRPSAEGKQVSLHFSAPSALPYVLGSQAHLLTMSSEILDNAIQYNLPKGKIWVDVELENDGHGVLLTVADSGVAVGVGELQHLFERFYRGENAAELGVPGTGLGLAIVTNVVKMHKGKADIELREDGGTAVSVWLPIAQRKS